MQPVLQGLCHLRQAPQIDASHPENRVNQPQKRRKQGLERLDRDLHAEGMQKLDVKKHDDRQIS
ncbi:MAG: hypothetical protein Q7T87_04280 [Polaromonas sp.]|nr:hypothetical protein [Polaromonas sp.]